LNWSRARSISNCSVPGSTRNEPVDFIRRVVTSGLMVKLPEDFVKDWLSLWLNTYVVNTDADPARTQMFTQVIQPWAVASGVTATLVTNPLTGVKSVTLTGPLDLDIAPFRLLGIVNRIDLGATASGRAVTAAPSR